jgi:Amt family ammonium transporter
MILGIIASIICYLAIQLKNRLGYDDSLDAFGIHGIGGITGAILLTFFIRQSWMKDAAAASATGWTVWNQLGIQVIAVLIAIAYAALMTYIIILVIDKIFKFKSTETDEMAGLDRSYHGERAYGMLNPN